MSKMLTQIELIIECRDYRVPLTSRNPLFEQSLAGRERVIVYTKRDLGSRSSTTDTDREEIIRQWHHPSSVLFTDHRSTQDMRKVLRLVKQHAQAATALTGSRLMVVGMPNVGKSSLLNALRKEGVGKGKAAHTGAQPGITRKISTSVKIMDSNEGVGGHEGVYLLDTPGVFMPYVPDSEAMLKLALCGSVKDTIVPPTTLADYLLFSINLVDPTLYQQYCGPTDSITELLDAIARKTGRLQKGGDPDVEAAALWMIQRWRTGHLGCFILDRVTEHALEERLRDEMNVSPSLNQARKSDKEARRTRARQRHLATA